MIFRRKNNRPDKKDFEPLTRIQTLREDIDDAGAFRNRYREGDRAQAPCIPTPTPSSGSVSAEPATQIADFNQDDPLLPARDAVPPTPDVNSPSAAAATTPPSAEPQTRLFGYSSAAASGAMAGTASVSPSMQQPQIGPPAGWLVIVKGPGRGAFSAVGFGMNSIGRAEGQRIQLNYGDDHISRENHAYVVYDSRHKQFFVSHGGGDNLTYLNGELVLGDKKELKDRDIIAIGQTELLLVMLCSQDFDWQEPE